MLSRNKKGVLLHRVINTLLMQNTDTSKYKYWNKLNTELCNPSNYQRNNSNCYVVSCWLPMSGKNICVAHVVAHTAIMVRAVIFNLKSAEL